jgi:putative flippase GtrA
VTALNRQIQNLRESGLLGQIIRFGVAGGLSTVIYSAVYLPLSLYVFDREHAVYAVPFAFLVAVAAGYFLHSRWSFKGHGTRDPGAKQQVQFVITWFGTAVLGYPAWAPLLPAILLATALTFFLNRQLVFK